MDIKGISQKMELPKGYLGKFEVNNKVAYEFQALGLELQPIYGKAIWSLFYKQGFTESKIRRAAEIAKKRNIQTIGYLIGIIKKL